MPIEAVAAAWAFTFALVLCRCGAAVMLLPGLGEPEAPAMLRAGLAVALAALLAPVVGQVAVPALPRLAGMACAELAWGAALGWFARCAVLALPIAGQIIAVLAGLSNIFVPDPALGQGSALMRLLSLAGVVLVFGTGLWAVPLAAIAGSYGAVPPGHLLPAPDGAEAAVRASSAAFALALRLAAPFLLAGLVWHLALGLLNRFIPSLQVYGTALPGQIAAGFALLTITATDLLDTWLDGARETFALIPGQ